MKTIVSSITLLFAVMTASPCLAAPTLTTPAAPGPGAGSATLVLQSGGTGTGYFTLLNGTNADCGTGDRVKAGQTAGGAVSPYSGSLLLTADTPANYTIRNLTGSTAYTICFTADSPSGSNLNQTPATANFTTGAAATFASPGWTPAGDSGFSAGPVISTSLAFAPDSTPYLAYQDGGNSSKATVMKYSAGSWSGAGMPGFSAGTASSTSLAFAPDGTPYVAYGGDDLNSTRATVLKYSTGTWTTVGSAGFSLDTAVYTSLAIAPDGAPYLAYADYGNGGKATVMKFSGGAWSPVGSPGFSAFDVAFTSLAIAPDGTPYVAYADYGNSGKATVMKYISGAWSIVGSAGFSAGTAANTSLAIAPDNTLYLAYQDGGNGDKATVMKSTGGAWTNLGIPGFSSGTATSPSLAIAPDGTLYLAYQDGSSGYKATVMKFSGSSWSTVGSSGFSAGSANSTSLAFSADGTPYVAYGDDGNGSRATVMKLINLSPTISGTPALIATVGAEYSFTPTSTYADSFSVSDNLPPGLSLDPVTGILSGTPTVAGIYSNIVITAANTVGSASLPAFSIEVFNFPDTVITSFPDSSFAAFAFAFISTTSGSSFECSLNNSSYAACLTPYSNSLAPCTTCRTATAMSFAVKAKNQAGNYDPTPAIHAWTITQTVGNLFSNVADNGAVQLQAADFTENVNINRPGVAFSCKGGYDAGYSTNSGLTNIHGTVTISAGTVTIENIVIM